MTTYKLNEKLFKKPPAEFSVAPFWFLNASLENNELKAQLSEMKAKGVDEVVFHARKGLKTEYLSDEWFEKTEYALSECARLGMNAWIYDEKDWPSGYAGGAVLALDPSLFATCLGVEKIYPVLGEPITVPEKEGCELECVVAVYNDERFVDITDYEKGECKPWAAETLKWEVFVFRREKCRHKPAYSNLSYVDLLNPEVAETFVKTTHAEYKKRLKKYWGTTIKGFFTDEPGFYQNYLDQCANLNTVIWSKDFAQRFKKNYGYDLRPYLCCLWQDMGDISVKTRCDYYKAVADFYKESYFNVIAEFLHKDGLKLIGHLHKEDGIETLVQTESDFFSAISAMDYSGIDCISAMEPRITEKLGSSAAHACGKKVCLSETFGCFGWGLTPELMKRTTDAQYVQGVNMLVPHAFYYSLSGERKTENPPSLFSCNGYWKHFKKYADYVKRLSFWGRSGNFRAETAIYFPVRSAWSRFRPLLKYEAYETDEELLGIQLALQTAHVDFDYLDDVTIASASVENGIMFGGENNGYKAVILPEIRVIPKESLFRLRDFAAGGGLVVCMGALDVTDDNGKADSEYAKALSELKKSPLLTFVKPYERKKIAKIVRRFVSVAITGGKADGVNLSKRDDGVRKSYLLVNSVDKERRFSLSERGEYSVEEWNAESGEVFSVPSAFDGEKTVTEILLPPYGSQIIAFSSQKSNFPQRINENSSATATAYDLSRGWKTAEGLPVNKLTFHSVGKNGYSGEITFVRTVRAEKPRGKVLFRTDKVKDYISLCINGKYAGARLWRPFELDVTEFWREGENEIRLIVGNTLENGMTGSDYDAGIFGKTEILYEE